jgi:DNA topoisomerase IB
MKATRSEMRPATDAEKKARGIPPAYKSTMIALDANADLQVTAITPAGKTAYFYSAEFIRRQEAVKWKRLAKVTKKIDAISERVERDSEDGKSEALTIRLILQTGLRNGGKMQGVKEAYGASSLRTEHVTLDGATLLLSFPGKRGVAQVHSLSDPVLAAYVQSRKDGGEERIFEHSAADTLRYLRRIAGPAVKVHDLRTWYANVLAEACVARMIAEALTLKKLKKAVAVEVSKKLGNSPSQALKSYINPRVFGEE